MSALGVEELSGLFFSAMTLQSTQLCMNAVIES